MERIAWHEAEPGHFEVDMVLHCGPTATGQFVHTPKMIDVNSGWSERVATLGRSYLVMADGFERILSRLPFAVHEIHIDNGNFFQPIMRLAEKIVVPRPGKENRIKRKYDQAKTPFDRLCATNCLDEHVKVQLQRQRGTINPRRLRQEIYDDLLRLSRMPSADTTQNEDIYQTLFQYLEEEVKQLFSPNVLVVAGD